MILAFFDAAAWELEVVLLLCVDDGNFSGTAQDYCADSFAFPVLTVFFDSYDLNLAIKLMLILVYPA
jgi:hypothetical protein